MGTSRYRGKIRAAIYRNGVKVAVVEFEGEISEEEVVKKLKEEVLKGTFDRQLTEVYRKVMEERKARRKAGEGLKWETKGRGREVKAALELLEAERIVERFLS